MDKQVRILAFLVVLLPLIQVSAYSENPKEFFPAARESKAFQLFKQRPHSDFSKLLYLIDRFEHSGIEVVYDGHYYKAAFAAKIARWFMVRNYKKENPSEWIMRWCNTSHSGKLIHVKFPTGKFRLSREVLFEELKHLEVALEEEAKAAQEKKASELPAALNLAPVANKLMTPEATPTAAPPIEAPAQR